ncbi:MAG: NADH-quinone oxidoreductase subunit C [Verrucomicrobia bacterium]|nr:NADH-quinone oxidoreductase subunit C [Verrucomicrobiota bacterium]
MPTSLDLARRLCDRFQRVACAPVEFRGETTVSVSDVSVIAEVMDFAKSGLGFNLLLDICGVDHPGEMPRFEIVYHIFSLDSRQYLRIKTRTGGENPEAPTVSGVWRAADWLEREVFDMMGIRFKGHPDMRRILMWESYPHHPLRKEFPLAGIPTGDGIAWAAPMGGGPFVTSPGEKTAVEREPRSQGKINSPP